MMKTSLQSCVIAACFVTFMGTSQPNCAPESAEGGLPRCDRQLNSLAKDSDIKFEATKLIELFRTTRLLQDGGAEKVAPEIALPMIHPSLNTKALCEMRIEGYDMFLLPELPVQLVSEISKSISGIAEQEGYAVFKPNFWGDIRKMQREEGLLFAFKRAEGHEPPNGVYFPKYKLIALNAHSNSGTLYHEHRHHKQYQELLKNAPKPSRWLRSDESLECIEELSSFLGELDATNVAYSYFEEVFDTITFPNPQDPDVESQLNPQLTYSNLESLNLQLHYPVQKESQVLQSKLCSSATQKMLEDMIEPIAKSSSALEETIAELRSRIVATHSRLAKNPRMCIENENSPECEIVKTMISRGWMKLKEAKAGLSAIISKRAKETGMFLRTKVEPDLASDLCEHSGGFRLMAGNCKVKGD